MWQALRKELNPAGLEVMTIGLETRGLAEAERWIAAAAPEHPALIDQAHVLDELYGVINVPSGIWVDETGLVVRPPETAFPARPSFTSGPLPEGISEYRRQVLTEARKIRVQPGLYVDALRDWVANGTASRFALPPDEVVRRSRERSPQAARAAAEFELAQHLVRQGRLELAAPHFRAARRLQPENWTYKRQAWVLASRDQAPSELFEGDWLSDVRRIGAENYYAPLEL